MAIVPKTKVLQVRVHDVQLEQFRQSCEWLGVRPTVRIRELMNADFVAVQAKRSNHAKWASRAFEKEQAMPVSTVVQNALVATSGKPGGLSERLKAEREAKRARKKKREDKGWQV